MRRYRFRLETISRIRDLEEHIAREKVMRAQYELHKANAMRDECADELRRFQIPSGVASISDLAWIGMQGERLGNSLAMAQEDVEKKDKACMEVKREWSERKKRASALVRLKARTRGEWKEEVLREEAGQLDEIATVRFILQGRES